LLSIFIKSSKNFHVLAFSLKLVPILNTANYIGAQYDSDFQNNKSLVIGAACIWDIYRLIFVIICKRLIMIIKADSKVMESWFKRFFSGSLIRVTSSDFMCFMCFFQRYFLLMEVGVFGVFQYFICIKIIIFLLMY
jgi:hypothetical protein